MKRVLLPIVLVLAACGAGGSHSPGVASLGAPKGSQATTTTVKPNRQDAIRLYAAWAACMRQHGVDLQDPTLDDKGSTTINLPSGMPFQTFQTANTSCEALHTQARQAAGLGPDTKPDPQLLLRFSRCMRAHGVPDFPDPSSDGGLQIKSSGNSDLSPDSPAFQKAQQACQDMLPNHGAGEKITASAGAGGPVGGPGAGPSGGAVVSGGK